MTCMKVIEAVLLFSGNIISKMRELAELEAAYNEFKTNPEKHPAYNRVWNDFWLNRKKELEKGTKKFCLLVFFFAFQNENKHVILHFSQNKLILQSMTSLQNGKHIGQSSVMNLSYMTLIEYLVFFI